MAALSMSICLLTLIALATSAPAQLPEQTTKNVDLRMPGVQPKENDTYLCHPLKVDDEMHIVGFIPHAKMDTAHHMLLYGCLEPGRTKGVWNCGEMLAKDSKLKQEPTCASGTGIVYAWGMDAPPLHLPKDVGFSVGGGNRIKWLVLQVHYKDVRNFQPPKNGTDKSGITLITTKKPLSKRAGVYLMATGGVIPAQTTVYMEAACSYNDPIVLHPFAFRTHAHTHGAVVSGYRVRNDEWTEIGRKSPQDPQMFYNVTMKDMKIREGDVLAARCTMVNKDDKDVYIGATQKDEMCNFYIMYYVDGSKLPTQDVCYTDGPPQFNWQMFSDPVLDLTKIPASASLVPGSKTPLAQSDVMTQVEEEFEQELVDERKQQQREMLSEQIMEYLDALSNFADEAAAEQEAEYGY